jgi:glycosyl transferase family 25
VPLNPNSDLPPIFVINRQSDTSRRGDMTERLAKVGLTPTFFPAVDGYKLDIPNLPDYDGGKRRRYFGKDLKAGEIGCLLSHRAIYQRMVDENIERAVVLEDDVFFADDFRAVLEDIQKTELPWDLIRFVGHGKVFDLGFRKLASLRHGYSITRVPTSPSGAYAYLLNKAAAQRLLQMMQRNWVPVDITHSRAWETGLETLLIHPSPATPDLDGPSTIGDERFDNTKRITGITRLLHPFCRFWYKLSNGVGKRVLYASSWFRDRKL